MVNYFLSFAFSVVFNAICDFYVICVRLCHFCYSLLCVAVDVFSSWSLILAFNVLVSAVFQISSWCIWRLAVALWSGTCFSFLWFDYWNYCLQLSDGRTLVNSVYRWTGTCQFRFRLLFIFCSYLGSHCCSVSFCVYSLNCCRLDVNFVRSH